MKLNSYVFLLRCFLISGAPIEIIQTFGSGYRSHSNILKQQQEQQQQHRFSDTSRQRLRRGSSRRAMLGSTLGSTTRQRQATTAHITTSNFNIVRVQEYVRENLVSKLGISKEDAVQSYFVPTLQSICADQLAKNFAKMPEIDALQSENPHLYNMVLSSLTGPAYGPNSILPLHVCVERVSEESFWKRCCMSRWSSGQLSLFLGNNEQLLSKAYGWKELYLEHLLSDFLLSLRVKRRESVPLSQIPFPAQGDDLNGGNAIWASDDDLQVLQELCAICRDYVHAVKLPCQITHLNWYTHLFAMLPHARAFRLSYGVSNAGIEYTSSMMGFTQNDAENIRRLLVAHPLEKLRLPSTRLQSAHAMAICAGLVGNQTLRVLDLSHNAIGDDSVRDALAVLLSQPDFLLEELYLGDNNLTGEGARALAEALVVNQSLRILDLSQNRIPDEPAGVLLVRALVQAPALQEVYLGCNLLAASTAAALIQILPQLQTLKSLDLAGNSRLGGGYSEKSITELFGLETLLTAVDPHSNEKMPATVQNPTSAQEQLESENKDAENDLEDEVTLLEPNNPDNSFVCVLSLSNKDLDPNESDTEQKKAEGAPSSVSFMKVSATGTSLLKAVQENASLRFIDVRRCGFTTNEEQAIEKAVQSRRGSK